MADYARRASRSVPLRLRSAPATLDEASRSVEFVAATEAPCQVWDWDSWDTITEVLLMAGLRLPPPGEARQIPLLDAHDCSRVGSVLGSFRNYVVEGPALIGRAHFSRVAEGEAAWIKVAEGHLTDVSVGYEINSAISIEAGKTATVGGREFSGPLRVVTDWSLRELSLCPLGADQAAKARSALNDKETTMRTPSKRQASGPGSGQRADAVCDYLQAADGLCTLSGGPVCTWLTGEGLCGKPAGEPRDPDPQDPETQGGDAPESTTANLPEATPEAGAAGAGAEAGRAASEAELWGVRSERRRINELTALCRGHAMPEDVLAGFIERGTTLEAARALVLERLQARSAAGFARVDMGAAEGDKVRAAARDSLLLRCGLTVENPSPGAPEMRSMSMRELARDFLVRAGQPLTGDIKTIVGRALTTTDLPKALTETAGKVLEDAFERAEHTWDQWAATGSLDDFKISHAVGVDFETTLRKIQEDGEYTYAYASERGEQVQLATYGRIYPITRQAIINDDLGVFTDMAATRGRAAANTINNLAYRALISNPVMSDGQPLFSAAHNNLFTGGGTPTIEKIGAVLTAMKKQKNPSGEYLRINPQFFLAPVALETAAETFFNSQLIGTSAQPNVTNLYGGQRFTRAYDPLLDDDDATTWYLLGPKGTSIKVYFLGGAQSPRLEEKQGWTIDGVEFKVSIDVAAAPVSWLGMAKSTETVAKQRSK